MTQLRRVTLVMALIGLAGCASVTRVLEERCADLGDGFRLTAGTALGLYFEAEATSWVHPAAGFVDVSLAPRWTVGWDRREMTGEVRSAAFPTLIFGWPIYGHHETSTGYGDSRPYWRGFLSPWMLAGHRHVAGRSHSLFALHHFVPHPRITEADSDRGDGDSEGWSADTWLGFSGTALLLGIDVGVNVVELTDFLVGCFGWDMLGDDDRNPGTDSPGTREG